MMTFKQSTQNLGHSARQAAIIGVAGLGLAAVISGPASAQTHHSGERSDDFTMMPRNMTPLEKPLCPTGQIAVGSTCVDVPAGGNTYQSWVKQFLGQTKCIKGRCTTINQDGSLRFWGAYSYRTVFGGLPQYKYDVLAPIPFFLDAAQAPVEQRSPVYGGGYITCWTGPSAHFIYDASLGIISDWGISDFYPPFDELDAQAVSAFTCGAPPPETPI